MRVKALINQDGKTNLGNVPRSNSIVERRRRRERRYFYYHHHLAEVG